MWHSSICNSVFLRNKCSKYIFALFIKELELSQAYLLSDHCARKIEITDRRKAGKGKSSQKINNIYQNNQQVTEEIKEI